MPAPFKKTHPMKHNLPTILALSLAAAGSGHPLGAADPERPGTAISTRVLPAAGHSALTNPAREILASVLNNLPAQPILMTGRIETRSETAPPPLHLDITMNRHDTPAVARYTVRDLQGKHPERLTIHWEQGVKPRITYATGTPLLTAAAPPLSTPIKNTDIRWSDLAMPFLWRTDGAILGVDRLKGRSCTVIAFPIREKPEGSLRLWIDRKFSMLLGADELDKNGTLRRRLRVKTIKKINNTWMVKDIEITVYPARRKTRIRIQQVNVLETNPRPN